MSKSARLGGWSLLVVAVLTAVGCAAPSVQGRGPSASATPSKATEGRLRTVDTSDPYAALLRRQLDEPWGRRSDKDDQLDAPMPDAKTWKRVRFWGVDHFTGFRYGEEHPAVAVVVVQDLSSGEVPTAELCMERFDRWAQPQADAFGVKLENRTERLTTWHGQALLIRTADGRAPFAFGSEPYSGAWAAYPAYPDACLIYAMAVPWRGQESLAKLVRDRWVVEGFRKLAPKTKGRPRRK